MGDKTGIEWTDATWNPLAGCSYASSGCLNCYAATQAAGRLSNTPTYEGLAVRPAGGGPAEFTGEIRLLHDRVDQPLRWRRPRRIFVNSMSDLFHPKVPVDFIAEIFAVMAASRRHTFQVLTKRPQRMQLVVSSDDFRALVEKKALYVPGVHGDVPGIHGWEWPLPNVWLGTSVEDQRNADMRVPHLLATPAAVRWLSCEPLLGPIDLPLTVTCPCCGGDKVHQGGEGGYGDARGFGCCDRCYRDEAPQGTVPVLDWVVVGGESGHGARPMHPDWARALRDQCVAAGVPYLFKQAGEWAPALPLPWRDADVTVAPDGVVTPMNQFNGPSFGGGCVLMRRVGKKAAGRELDGREWDEYPR